MPLIKRLSRAFRADMHAVLDSIEEPVSLLKQAVREMEDDVLRDQQQLKQLTRTRDHQQSTQRNYHSQLDEISEEIGVSFAADHHDLAKKAIRRKLELEKAVKALAGQQQSVERLVDELQQRLKENQEKLNVMRQKQEVLISTSDFSDEQSQYCEIGVTDDEVEIAFLKEQKARAAS